MTVRSRLVAGFIFFCYRLPYYKIDAPAGGVNLIQPYLVKRCYTALIFAFSLNRFVGSYSFLIFNKRSKLPW